MNKVDSQVVVEFKVKQEDAYNLEAQFDQTILIMLLMNVRVAGVHNPLGVTQVARQMGIREFFGFRPRPRTILRSFALARGRFN